MFLAASTSPGAAIAKKLYAASTILRTHITRDQCDEMRCNAPIAAQKRVADSESRTLATKLFSCLTAQPLVRAVQVAVLRESRDGDSVALRAPSG
ncbi:hypothetical protein ACRQ5Q_19315 [Bradyrhizobium sp. PMVTL-01]|uniref:hypothetical protein n=1 Tax=Bradyrhizobium sp. PMVTL-01 TaxID=3434999 RepID=UPI003F6F63C0